MKFALCFTNFGPYHLARLRALATRLSNSGDRLIAYEVAGSRAKVSLAPVPLSMSRSSGSRSFPSRLWKRFRPATAEQPFWKHSIVIVPTPSAQSVMYGQNRWLLHAGRSQRGRPAILMSESQAIDRPHVWWKELVKRHRMRLFDAALVGGTTHRDYLVQLGMPAWRIALGYNAVDNDFFASSAQMWRQHVTGRAGLPAAPYFLTVCRFVPEKNLIRLIRAFARYHAACSSDSAWHLVICGGGPLAPEITQAIIQSGCDYAIHCPGFLQSDALPRWYAHAGAFVLPSLSEPWGLVANEAAASSLPLLISSRAGCAATLIPEPDGTTGSRLDPIDIEAMTNKLGWMASLSNKERTVMGQRAAAIVSEWGSDRFAQGTLEALDLARVGADIRRRARSPLVKAR